MYFIRIIVPGVNPGLAVLSDRFCFEFAGEIKCHDYLNEIWNIQGRLKRPRPFRFGDLIGITYHERDRNYTDLFSREGIALDLGLNLLSLELISNTVDKRMLIFGHFNNADSGVFFFEGSSGKIISKLIKSYFRFGWTSKDVNVVASQSKLTAYDLVLENELWIYSLEQETISLNKFIGTHTSLLLIALSQNTIIALDINTGHPIHKWQAKRMAPGHMCLDSKRSKIVGLVGYTYTEIDLNTMKLTQFDHTECFKSLDIMCRSIGQGTLDDKNIIFSSLVHKENADYSVYAIYKIAAFSTITQKVVWDHMFECEQRRPQVQDGRIFVVDDNKVLHVFEREDRGKAIIT